jgi:hypothetical protein
MLQSVLILPLHLLNEHIKAISIPQDQRSEERISVITAGVPDDISADLYGLLCPSPTF